MEDKELDALIASVLKSRPLKDTRDFRDAVGKDRTPAELAGSLSRSLATILARSVISRGTSGAVTRNRRAFRSCDGAVDRAG